jgi:hypothetical protein
MDLALLWIALAAFVGALVGNVIKWLGADGETPKQFLQGLLTGFIAALVFAGAYQLSEKVVTIYDLFAAVVAGAGVVLGQSQIALSGTLKRMGKTFREF